MSLSEHSNEMNSTLDMLHKIADKLGIPQQGQSEAQLALDIHLILKVELIVHHYDIWKEYIRGGGSDAVVFRTYMNYVGSASSLHNRVQRLLW